MITVAEAIQLIRETTSVLPPRAVPLADGFGCALATDIFAAMDLPPFHQSAMDGYAVRYADLAQTKSLPVAAVIAAGDEGVGMVPPLHAVRIFTGAPVPDGLDTVVMQEKTTVAEGKVTVHDEALACGTNVRSLGSEIRKGQLAMTAGTVLTPAAIGYLAGLGVATVAVYPKPCVHLIITGKELKSPGQSLQRGQVYESNSVMLKTALLQLGITKVASSFAGDDVDEIKSALDQALANADIILLTGGVSVGDYDLVTKAMEARGVAQVFHKVAQRPGKPLYMGKKEKKIIFGLPGNPASVLSCFYNFVVLAIERLASRTDLLQRKQLPLRAPFEKKIGLRQFLKAHCTDAGVMPLSAQESFRLSSFSAANCLVILPEEAKDYQRGDKVEVLLLPYL